MLQLREKPDRWSPEVAERIVRAQADEIEARAASSGMLSIGHATADDAPVLNPSDLTWQLGLMSSKVSGLRFEGDLGTLNQHATLDLLLACRNCLNETGTLSGLENLFPGDRAAWCADALNMVGLMLRTKPGDRGSFAVRSAGLVPETRGFPEKLHVLGDSHCLFPSGRYQYDPGMRVDDLFERYEGLTSRFIGLHVGPGLAANLLRTGTTTSVREKTLHILQHGYIPRGGRILFSFGEIDCRYHVLRQAETQAIPVENVVQAICATYVGFLDVIAGAGYRVGVWAPFATTWRTEHEYEDYPIYGSAELRDLVMRLFNSIMQHECGKRGYDFLSLFAQVRGLDGLPDRRYFHDYIHLSQAARPLLHELTPNG